MKFSSLNFGLLLAAVVKASSPIGWGKNTVGGEGGVEYHVSTYKEFKDALDNNGNPTGPKIIYIEAPINGISLDDGSIMNFESLVPGFSLDSYIACFSEDGSEWLDTPECNTIEELRQQGRPIQSGQIHVDVTPNTTIIGNGNDAKLVELSLQIRHTENVIIKNLSVEAPNDYFPEWDPTDGIHGSWNAEYDAIVIKNATNVWVDNCYLGDGSTGVGTFPEVFGHHIETHDGLLDVVDGADYITISNNRFENHKKTMLIGNSDKKTTDRDHLKVTLYNNVFINCNERMPRVRFGKVHVFNNYFYAETFNEAYESLTVNNYFHNDEVFPQYFMGLGVECNILSEYNSFHYAGNEEIPASDDIVVYSYGGYTFHDNGSEYNGESIDLDTLAEESFKLKVKTKMAQNARDGKENPEWVNAAFTTESFVPSEYYDYEVVENIEYVDDLINKVPSWMFGTPDEIETVEDTVLPEDTPFEPEIINEPETTEPSEPEQPQVEQPQPEQPQIEQPQVEQPQVEQPQVEQPQVEQPQVEQPQVEQPQVEQPQVEQPQVEQPQVEQPQVEQPQVEQPQPEQPQPEQPQPEQQPPQQVQPPQEQQPQPPQQLPPKQPPQQIQPGQQVQPPHQPQQPQPPQQIQPPQQPQQPQQPQGSYNDQSIRYYSCGPQDYQCKNRMSNECYTSLSQCFSQSQVSDHEKCQELNRICSKIWS